MIELNGARLFRTLRQLQPRQAFYYFWRRGIGARSVSPWAGTIKVRPYVCSEVLPAAALATPSATFDFTFLNLSLSFPVGAMNWRPQNANRLWRYNLHYFDFLSDARPLDEKYALLDDWVAQNPPGSEPAWEAYTVSLRIVNWCKFFWGQPAGSIKSGWGASLYHQARWLEKNLELHILANHYFENIKALQFAAVFFDDDNSTRWLQQFQGELLVQLQEQILADGGHYERSPQYHCVLLEGLIDLSRLVAAYPQLFDEEVLTSLHRALRIALQFIATIATPDDDIPLFNDSARGAAAKPSVLLQRARELGITINAIDHTRPVAIDLPDSGLYGWRASGDYFLIDCGDIGPSYQPGHTHCDFLSYELMLDGRWLIVDSGVCEYEPGELRRYVRSTAAHNTVTVDGQEQSEVWGEFRVGDRARRLDAEITRTGDDLVFTGSYRGFAQIPGGAKHRRHARISLAGTGRIRQIEIEDHIEVAGELQVQSFIHLHPFVQAHIAGNMVELRHQDRLLAVVQTLNIDNIELAEGWYCPRFGDKQANTVLVFTCNKSYKPAYTITPKN